MPTTLSLILIRERGVDHPHLQGQVRIDGRGTKHGRRGRGPHADAGRVRCKRGGSRLSRAPLGCAVGPGTSGRQRRKTIEFFKVQRWTMFPADCPIGAGWEIFRGPAGRRISAGHPSGFEDGDFFRGPVSGVFSLFFLYSRALLITGGVRLGERRDLCISSESKTGGPGPDRETTYTTSRKK